MKNYFKYKFSENELEYCKTHAQKMCDGFSTYSFKNDEKQSFDVYFIGKVGEFVVYKFLRKLEKENLIKIIHKPFREKYLKLNFNDDYIIELCNSGKKIQIEVRTKGRSVEPQQDYVCCTDCIKPNLNYIFVSYNKKNNIAHIVGFANWDNFKKYATVSSEGDKNLNFIHKVNEFNILIKHLNNIFDFIK